MPRLSRDDAWRVIEALQQLSLLDPGKASQLEVARLLGRLTQRADQAAAIPTPRKLRGPAAGRSPAPR
jgi:hypothetical protein